MVRYLLYKLHKHETVVKFMVRYLLYKLHKMKQL